jgi:hypothetical protein
MYAFIGGKKRPKKTLESAVRAVADGYEGEKAIFDTETGKVYSLSGEPTTILTPSEFQIVTEILGICSICSAANIPFPTKTVSALIGKLSPVLAGPAVRTAAEIYKKLRGKHGNRESERSESPG